VLDKRAVKQFHSDIAYYARVYTIKATLDAVSIIAVRQTDSHHSQ